MTKLLQQAVSEIEQLPPEAQDDFAAWMLAELRSEQRWQELLAASPDLLERLANEALEEHRAGKTLPLDPETL
jgi:hypothetical protein